MAEDSPSTTVEDVTCTGCGCLCDDITTVSAGGRVVEARNACRIGLDWFLRPPLDIPAATIDGQPLSVERAIARAAELLAAARSPLILGLPRLTIEAQSAALALAERIGATVSLDAARPRVQAFQRIGEVSATLGEVKNRADVIVFWRADPLTTHPRHWERYSVEPRGWFVPDGRAERAVLVVDVDRTPTAERADAFLPLKDGVETLWALRARLAGVAVDPVRLERGTGLTTDALDSWADRLRRAKYGAWFMPSVGLDSIEYEAIFTLVRDFNRTARFIVLSLGEPGNAAGAEAVLTWRSGQTVGADFASVPPRELPAGTSAATMFARDEADVLLDLDGRSDVIPTVSIAPDATARTTGIAIATATPGIETGGTVLRCDGVMLPLRPSLAPSRPTDRDVLAALLAKVEGRAR